MVSVLRGIEVLGRHPMLRQVIPACSDCFERVKHDIANTRESSHVHVDGPSNADGNVNFKSLGIPNYIDSPDSQIHSIIARDLQVLQDFVSEEEEESLVSEVDPYIKRLRYESQHWDDAIHGYRETERKKWNEKNEQILERVRTTAFQPGTPYIGYVHVLDLAREGSIKPHIDSIRFCGNTIAGLSLLSPSVMRLVTKDKSRYADVLLKQRSLYIMKGDARYEFTHEILGLKDSKFKGQEVAKVRRISIICRNEPTSCDPAEP